jgi:phospholipid transport system transporter-binding protein
MAEKLDASVRLEENQLFVSGPVTYGSVAKITQAGLASMNHHDLVIDLVEITEVDSSAVSMLLEWLRAAHAHNFQLRFVNLPGNLVSLIQLYDVTDLIPVNSHNQI